MRARCKALCLAKPNLPCGSVQALPTATEAASRELWKLVQHHRPFCQPLAVSPLLQRLLEPLAPVSGATMRQVSPLQTSVPLKIFHTPVEKPPLCSGSRLLHAILRCFTWPHWSYMAAH